MRLDVLEEAFEVKRGNVLERLSAPAEPRLEFYLLQHLLDGARVRVGSWLVLNVRRLGQTHLVARVTCPRPAMDAARHSFSHY